MTITIGRHGPPRARGRAAPRLPPPQPRPRRCFSGRRSPRGCTLPPPRFSGRGPQPPATAPGAPYVRSGCVPVQSPAVGAFWVAPQPGAPPFAEVGRTVAEGDQLAIVEVMKLMNPVLASQAGEIVQVCAANAELVEYDQVLFWIKPTGPGEPADG